MNPFCTEDFRLALRRIRKQPGATIASVAALACGMGAAVVAWTLFSAVLLEPLAVKEPDRLFLVDKPSPLPDSGLSFPPVHSHPAFEAIRDSGAFDGLAAGDTTSVPVTEPGGIPQRRNIHFGSYDFFETLGVSPALGRTFTAEEARRGAAPVVVLSNRYWRSAFNADPAVLGRTLRLRETPATIIGVLPPEFRGLNLAESPDLYLPLHTVNDLVGPGSFDFLGASVNWIRIVGRLRPDETPSAAMARLDALDGESRRREYFLTDVNTAAIPAAARAGMTQFTTLLAITIGLLLLIGCLTVGMLLLVRTEDRRDELAVCFALGATRMRLASGIAVEAVLLCTLGAALAIPVTLALFSGLRLFQLPGRIEIGLLDLSFAPGAWLLAAGGTLTVTFAIALLATSFGLTAGADAPLQSRAVATSRMTRRGPRTAFVAAQVAITLVLVTGAGLFTRSLSAALSLNSDIDTARTLTADVSLDPYSYTAARASAFFDLLLERLRQNGAIESVAVSRVDGGVAPGFNVTIDGAPREMPSTLTRTAVHEDYFTTMGLPVSGGRSFTRSDTSTSPLVVVVSESLGRLIAGGGNPIGHRITEQVNGSPVVAEIIGVVPDVILDVNTTAPLVMYYSAEQWDAATNGTLVFRATGRPSDAVREARAAIRGLDARVVPGPMLTLDEQIGRQMNPQRFGLYVLGGLGGIALLLTVLGTYVMAESMVVKRRREMSIRAAMGATGTHLGGLVLRDTARLVGIGLIVGVGLAFLGARTIRALLYEVEPLDPTTLTMTAAVILGLALVVSLRPALEAMRLDLTRSLREE